MTILLAVGDIHLGRSPAALHPDLVSQAAELGPEAAWSRTVTEAINRGVDGVLLAGDVVDRSRDLLVAYGDLKAGVEKLAIAGIPVLAVAGNHDTLVLPRLAAEIHSLQLLGADGRWQEKTLGKFSIMGWSFPRPQVRQSPLKDFPQPRDPARTIGLLHCDRDQHDSVYAPVSSAELEAAPTGAWLLGHIHRPDPLAGPRPIGYLGSLSALRASETGARGPWLVEAAESGIRATQLPLGPLRYETLPVDLSEIDSVERVEEAVLAASRGKVQQLLKENAAPDVLGLRLELTGACSFERELPRLSEQLQQESRPWRDGGMRLFIQKVSIRTRAHFDLDRLAQRSDPCGLLARRLQLLDQPDAPAHRELLNQARVRLLRVATQREFQALEVDVDDQALRDYLRRAGQRALIELLAQRRDSA